MIRPEIVSSSCTYCGKKISDLKMPLEPKDYIFYAIGSGKVLFFCSITCINEFPFTEGIK